MKRRIAGWVTVLIAVMAMGSIYASPAERSKAQLKLNNRIENRKHGISVKAKRPEAVSQIKSIPSVLRKTNPDIDMPAITHCPFLYDFFLYSSGFPVITAFGELMIIYTSDWTSVIQYSKSSSGGAEWSEPVEVTESSSPEQISGIRTAEGRIIAVWREIDASYQLAMIHSDDDGATWSEKTVFENEALMPFSPTVYQSADGRLWLFYSRTYDWNTIETIYSISEDGGDTWGGESVFPTSGYWSSEVTMVSEPGMPVVVLYDEGDAFESVIYARALLAGGEWTDPATPVTDPGGYAVHPRAFLKSDGSQVLVYTKQDKYWWNPFFDYGQTTIETMTYQPITDTWSDPIPFTRYAGWNDFSNACLLEDKPFIVFASDRWGTVPQLWYGLAGESEDVNPPPAFIGSMVAEPRSNRPVALLAYAFDESSVAGVTYTMARNGVPAGPFMMADNGLTWDSLAADGIWGAATGPFDPGDEIDFSFTIRDDGGNTVETNSWEFNVPAVHDAGNMVLQIGDDSSIGSPDLESLAAYWPKWNGQGYLYWGGFWAGAMVGGEKRASNFDWGGMDWRRVSGTPFTVGPGLSDQDVNVTYADTSELEASPIGLVVHQTSLQWADPSKDDFVIFNYSVRNSGDSGDLDSLFAGMWLDPDVPWDDWDNNLAEFDAARQMLIVRSAGEEPAGLFGVRMLGPGKAPFSAHALPYDDEIGDGIEDPYRYDLMTSGTVTVPEDSADYRLLVTHPPFALASGDSFTVSFGIVLGSGMEELQANADTMLAVYSRIHGPSAVERGSGSPVPLSFGLDQNHPNPFNPSTFIGFRLASDGPVSVRVYDLMGREVAVLADRFLSAGSHRLEWNASGFESGVYFCRIQTGDFTAVRKMVLMK